DPQVYFRRFFQDEDYSNAILIIDEAHNLVQRALEYYSPSLTRRQVHEVGKSLGHVEPSLAREIRKFLRAMDEVFRIERADEYSQVEQETESDGKMFIIDSPKAFFDQLKPTVSRLSLRYLLDKIESGRVIPDDPVDDFFAELGKFYSVLGME